MGAYQSHANMPNYQGWAQLYRPPDIAGAVARGVDTGIKLREERRRSEEHPLNLKMLDARVKLSTLAAEDAKLQHAANEKLLADAVVQAQADANLATYEQQRAAAISEGRRIRRQARQELENEQLRQQLEEDIDLRETVEHYEVTRDPAVAARIRDTLKEAPGDLWKSPALRRRLQQADREKYGEAVFDAAGKESTFGRELDGILYPGRKPMTLAEQARAKELDPLAPEARAVAEKEEIVRAREMEAQLDERIAALEAAGSETAVEMRNELVQIRSDKTRRDIKQLRAVRRAGVNPAEAKTRQELANQLAEKMEELAARYKELGLTQALDLGSGKMKTGLTKYSFTGKELELVAEMLRHPLVGPVGSRIQRLFTGKERSQYRETLNRFFSSVVNQAFYGAQGESDIAMETLGELMRDLRRPVMTPEERRQYELYEKTYGPLIDKSAIAVDEMIKRNPDAAQDILFLNEQIMRDLADMDRGPEPTVLIKFADTGKEEPVTLSEMRQLEEKGIKFEKVVR